MSVTRACESERAGAFVRRRRPAERGLVERKSIHGEIVSLSTESQNVFPRHVPRPACVARLISISLFLSPSFRRRLVRLSLPFRRFLARIPSSPHAVFATRRAASLTCFAMQKTIGFHPRETIVPFARVSRFRFRFLRQNTPKSDCIEFTLISQIQSSVYGFNCEYAASFG